MITPKTCRLLKVGKKYIGSKSYVFGFLHTQDALMVKDYVTSQRSNIVIQEKPNLSMYTIVASKKATKPVPVKLCNFPDIIQCAFYLEVNNVDLVLIDHVNIQKNKAILYSNYDLDLFIDSSLKKDQLQRVYNGGKINYFEIMNFMSGDASDINDDDDFMNHY